MKATQFHARAFRGFTLIELTLVIAVLLTLITVTLIASQRYIFQSNRAGCLLNQNTIFKVLTADSNFKNRPFEAGVDYFSTAETQQLFEQEPLCPSGGGYSAKLDADGKHLVITCKQHGDDHK